jgi:hypothetical protein
VATFDQVRHGLAANLATIRFSNGVKPAVSPYMQSNPIPPGIQVFPGPLSYDLAMGRGLDEPTWVVQGYVAFTTDIGSQTLLDELCAPAGPSSVKQAVEADRTLSGLVAALQVVSMSGYRIANTDTGALVVAEWDVTIWAPN